MSALAACCTFLIWIISEFRAETLGLQPQRPKGKTWVKETGVFFVLLFFQSIWRNTRKITKTAESKVVNEKILRVLFLFKTKCYPGSSAPAYHPETLTGIQPLPALVNRSIPKLLLSDPLILMSCCCVVLDTELATNIFNLNLPHPAAQKKVFRLPDSFCNHKKKTEARFENDGCHPQHKVSLEATLHWLHSAFPFQGCESQQKITWSNYSLKNWWLERWNVLLTNVHFFGAGGGIVWQKRHLQFGLALQKRFCKRFLLAAWKAQN